MLGRDHPRPLELTIDKSEYTHKATNAARYIQGGSIVAVVLTSSAITTARPLYSKESSSYASQKPRDNSRIEMPINVAKDRWLIQVEYIAEINEIRTSAKSRDQHCPL
jgi:hypothetical protein